MSSILLLCFNLLLAQETNKGKIILSFSIGPSFANFKNGEAPHKLYLFGSDHTQAIMSSNELTNSPAYTDYKTSLNEDILIGISTGIKLEYFIKDQFNIVTGISYESKGIDLEYSNTKFGYIAADRVLDKNLEIRIINKYLTLPILLKRNLTKNKNIFLEGGVYIGYLISSRINFLNEETISDDSGVISKNSFWIDNKRDSKKEYTNKFDFGFTFGTGYITKLSENLLLKTEMLMNIGMIKLDAKYNNEYTVTPVASMNMTTVAVRSTNYFGLNSKSKNLNLAFVIGLGYKISK